MTPNEIQNKTFEKKMGGYKVEEVGAYLCEVAACVQGLMDEKGELEKKMMVIAEKLEEYREDEDSLRAALIGAQKLGDSVVRDAKKKAEQLLAEASVKAEELVSDARSSLDREAIALSRMQGQVAEFKTQILNMYKRHIEMINSIPDDPYIPRDVKEIVDTAIANEAERPEREDKVDSFVLSYDDESDEEQTGEDAVRTLPGSPAEGGHKHKRLDYGNLRFGEEYNLTRKD